MVGTRRKSLECLGAEANYRSLFPDAARHYRADVLEAIAAFLGGARYLRISKGIPLPYAWRSMAGPK